MLTCLSHAHMSTHLLQAHPSILTTCPSCSPIPLAHPLMPTFLPCPPIPLMPTHPSLPPIPLAQPSLSCPPVPLDHLFLLLTRSSCSPFHAHPSLSCPPVPLMFTCPFHAHLSLFPTCPFYAHLSISCLPVLFLPSHPSCPPAPLIPTHPCHAHPSLLCSPITLAHPSLLSTCFLCPPIPLMPTLPSHAAISLMPICPFQSHRPSYLSIVPTDPSCLSLLFTVSLFIPFCPLSRLPVPLAHTLLLPTSFSVPGTRPACYYTVSCEKCLGLPVSVSVFHVSGL